MISLLELKCFPHLIIITLLETLQSFHLLLDHLDLLGSLLNNLRSRHNTFTRIIPTQMYLTPPTIQSFERCHPNTRRNTTCQLQHAQIHNVMSPFTSETQISGLLDYLQFSNHHHRYMQRLSAQSIDYHIGFTRMVTQTKIIILQKFEPPHMHHIQLFLIEQVLQTMVIT